MADYLQYGALGVVVIMLIGIYQLTKLFVTNFLESFKDLVATVKAIVPVLGDVKNETAGLRMDINSRPCIAKDRP